jgi:hypothetical protein
MRKTNHCFLFLIFILSSSYFVTAFAQGHQHSVTSTGDGNFNPSLIADQGGGFYLAYIARTNGKSNVMLRYSTDGKTFSQPVRVNHLNDDAAVRNENPPKIAVAPNGNIYVCWANERARWKGNIRFARSTDGGKSFSSAITLNSDIGGEPKGHAFQSLAIDQKGKVYVAWIDERNKQATDRGAEIWLSVSTDHGKTFSFNRKILSDVCECCRTNLQADSTGRLYLSYRTVPENGPMYRDIIVARSGDGGKSFKKTIVSRDRWDINACPIAGPSLCIDNKDRIYTVWFTGSGDRPALYYAASSDRGASYSPRKLIDPSQSFGKHAQAVPLSNGKVIVAWEGHTDHPVIFWGVLDIRQGLLHKSAAHQQVTYPTVAAKGSTVILAGLRNGRDLLLNVDSLSIPIKGE